MDFNKGCLIVHGFGGCLDEISPLASRLEEEGYQVICPVLAGHTGRRRDLKGVNYKQWVSSAEEGLKELLSTCEEVYLIGFSMGGLISLYLATRYKVSGVITLNSPIFYWDVKRIALNILEDIKLKKLDNTRRYLSSSKSFPISALFNFRILLSKAKPLLKEVHCPVFIAQALEDDTVRTSSASFLTKNIASQQKVTKYYEKSGHLILWSKSADQVINDVIQFVETY